MNLLEQKCIPCEGGVEPIAETDAQTMLAYHIPDWELMNNATCVEKTFIFKNFKDALDFTNKVGALAEDEGHHPDIMLFWGKVKINLTTHAIGGLSQNDFILAAKINHII